MRLEPVPPINRPQRITGCIYVELEEPVIHPGGRTGLWILAPYEVAVTHDRIVVAYVTPLSVKYTLIGDIVGGSICRHHRSPSAEEFIKLSRRPGEAYVRVEINGPSARIPGIGFYAATLPIYSDEESRLYYPLLEAETSDVSLNVKVTHKPPLEGLELAQRGRRVSIFLPSFLVPL